MDRYNNVNREVDLYGRRWKIIEVSPDGKVYMLCDAYGRERLISVDVVMEKGTNLY